MLTEEVLKANESLKDLTEEQIQTRVKELAAELSKEYAGKELINGMEFICDDTDNNSDVLYFKKK